jgi:hypothetical protein
MADTATCKHGNPFYCGRCEAESAPKCIHGNPFYCVWCGTVLTEGQCTPHTSSPAADEREKQARRPVAQPESTAPSQKPGGMY